MLSLQASHKKLGTNKPLSINTDTGGAIESACPYYWAGYVI